MASLAFTACSAESPRTTAITPHFDNLFKISTRFIVLHLSYIEILIYISEIQLEYNSFTKNLKDFLLKIMQTKKESTKISVNSPIMI